MNGIPYKDTVASKGSKLFEALTTKDEKASKSVYDETTKNFDRMYASAAADRAWYRNWRTA